MSESAGSDSTFGAGPGPAGGGGPGPAAGPGPSVAEAYAFVCMNCGYGWEQAFEIERHVDGLGRPFVTYLADGVRVPSPLTSPTCGNCEGHRVRIMRAGQVARCAVRPPRPARPAHPAGEPRVARPRHRSVLRFLRRGHQDEGEGGTTA